MLLRILAVMMCLAAMVGTASAEDTGSTQYSVDVFKECGSDETIIVTLEADADGEAEVVLHKAMESGPVFSVLEGSGLIFGGEHANQMMHAFKVAAEKLVASGDLTQEGADELFAILKRAHAAIAPHGIEVFGNRIGHMEAPDGMAVISGDGEGEEVIVKKRVHRGGHEDYSTENEKRIKIKKLEGDLSAAKELMITIEGDDVKVVGEGFSQEELEEIHQEIALQELEGDHSRLKELKAIVEGEDSIGEELREIELKIIGEANGLEDLGGLYFGDEGEHGLKWHEFEDAQPDFGNRVNLFEWSNRLDDYQDELSALDEFIREWHLFSDEIRQSVNGEQQDKLDWFTHQMMEYAEKHRHEMMAPPITHNVPLFPGHPMPSMPMWHGEGCEHEGECPMPDGEFMHQFMMPPGHEVSVLEGLPEHSYFVQRLSEFEGDGELEDEIDALVDEIEAMIRNLMAQGGHERALEEYIVQMHDFDDEDDDDD